MTTHDHEDRVLCEQLRAAGRSHGDHTVAHEAADRIETLLEQQASDLELIEGKNDAIVRRDGIIASLRAELENQRLSMMATANAVARGRASIEERLNRTRQLLASDATAWHLNKEIDR